MPVVTLGAEDESTRDVGLVRGFVGVDKSIVGEAVRKIDCMVSLPVYAEILRGMLYV